MTAKRIRINKAIRYPASETFDTLDFNQGVNVIVGELNAGKTKWLQIIDYILGDPGKTEDAFDKDLTKKYDKAILTVSIGENSFDIERRWKEAGSKSKIYVNNEGLTPKLFSEFILNELNIPIIIMPSGNPFGDRTWPELSWREMFRHMYKQERFWSDLTQKQSDVVRVASILNFLNSATSLYSKEFGDLVAKKKAKERLQAQKDVFVEVLQNMAVELINQPEMNVAITPDSIAESRNRLNARQVEITNAKKQIYSNYDQNIKSEYPEFDSVKQDLESLHNELGAVENARNACIKRYSELSEYTKTLEAEQSRFERVKTSSNALSDLKVTHCPVCDQEIVEKPQTDSHCYLCNQTYDNTFSSVTEGNQRVDFEIQQVSEELLEMQELTAKLHVEIEAFTDQISHYKSAIESLKHTLTSANELSIHAMPPELAIFDQEVGKISAQLEQLSRIEKSLSSREEMNSKILKLEEEIALLDTEVKRVTPSVDFSGIADLLSDRMNTYLNLVGTDTLSRWKTGRVSLKISRDCFELLLDGQPWTIKAGGTANYIIQIAYHYALLSLSKDVNNNYPGFLIMDFPPHFSRSDDLRDSENYLLKPFVDLCAKPEMAGSQVIIAGRAFFNLAGANIINL